MNPKKNLKFYFPTKKLFLALLPRRIDRFSKKKSLERRVCAGLTFGYNFLHGSRKCLGTRDKKSKNNLYKAIIID